METIDTFRPKYQAFLESNMSARAFCGQIWMKESHFYYWQAKIHKEAAHRNGEFLPVSINNHAGKVVLTSGQGTGMMKMAHPVCEIVFPNGVTVRLSGEVSAQKLGQLIMIGAIADVQPDGHQQVLPVSASDGHAQELLHAERHRHQPDGSRRAGRRRVHLHQQAVHKHECPSCGMRRSGHLSSKAGTRLHTSSGHVLVGR